MFTKSLWNQFAEIKDYPSLTDNTSADVAIIGGGVTGISLACNLAQREYNVVVLESLKVGGGTSSHSTGNLYFTVDENLGYLTDKYNNDEIRQVIKARSDSLDKMEAYVKKYNLDCDFKRLPWYFYSSSSDYDSQIEKEFKTAQNVGIAAEWADYMPLPFRVSKAVKVENQAQINPMRYVQELASSIESENCRIYECTRVKEVEEKEDVVILKTTGGTVTAKYAVHATHIPKGILPVQTALSMHREYGIAFEVDNLEYPEGIFWGLHDNGKKYSTRIYSRGGKKFFIAVGEAHKVGQAESNIQSINNLKEFARKHLAVSDVSYQWGGQNYKPADLLPYIGRMNENSRVFMATGYSTDGLVYGTLAGILIADEIDGRKNEFAELFKPRFTPIKSAVNFIKENLDTAKQYLKNLPGVADEDSFKDIKSGEGAVIEKKGVKIAASRDDNGKLLLVSAVCTHMKCIVNWNNLEQTWDCPCHASRFKRDGTVLEGPAYDPLPPIDLTDI